MRKLVPIFFICDDAYMKYINVCIKSLVLNASPENDYEIHILNTDITEKTMEITRRLETPYVKINFDDVTLRLEKIKDKLFVRDYYNLTTYYRFFIADMFPQFDKVIYIDGDTVVLDDIARLYDIDLEDNLIGGAHEQAFVQSDIYGTYNEKVLGISRYDTINAGVMLIDTYAFRKENMLAQFIKLLGEYKFVVTQDEDYLNVLCNGRIKFIDDGWNAQTFMDLVVEEKDIKLIHYDMAIKPWTFAECKLANYFWFYAKQTEYYDELKLGFDNFTEEKKEKALGVFDSLEKLAISEIERPDNYYKMKLKNASRNRFAYNKARALNK